MACEDVPKCIIRYSNYLAAASFSSDNGQCGNLNKVLSEL